MRQLNLVDSENSEAYGCFVIAQTQQLNFWCHLITLYRMKSPNIGM